MTTTIVRRPASLTARRPPARAQQPTARLTRRGRVLLVGLLAVLALLCFSLGRASSEASAGGAPALAPTTVVQPGETLWQIAQRVAPAEDPRAVVARIAEQNDLRSGPLSAGRVLRLPAPLA